MTGRIWITSNGSIGPRAQRTLRLCGFVVGAIALTGCAESPLFGGQGQSADVQSVQLVARDVEAPEVFQIADLGQWDGAASDGGVWVSHATATTPQRVIIRYPATGAFVIGVLLARGGDTASAFGLSSDAAEALGIAANEPVEIDVTALRREDGSPEPEAVPTPAFDTPAALAEIEPAPAPRQTRPAQQPSAVEAPALDQPTQTAPAMMMSQAAVLGLNAPYVQVGQFTVEANVTDAAARLRAAGIVPTILESADTPTTWRIIIGPATSAEERALVLEQVKAQGFADAFFVSN